MGGRVIKINTTSSYLCHIVGWITYSICQAVIQEKNPWQADVQYIAFSIICYILQVIIKKCGKVWVLGGNSGGMGIHSQYEYIKCIPIILYCNQNVCYVLYIIAKMRAIVDISHSGQCSMNCSQLLIRLPSTKQHQSLQVNQLQYCKPISSQCHTFLPYLLHILQRFPMLLR